MSETMVKLSDFSYEANYSDEEFAKAEAFLDTCQTFTGTANFGLFGPDKVEAVYKNQACHAALSYPFTDQNRASLIASEALSNSVYRSRDYKPLKLLEDRKTGRSDRDKGVVDGFFNWFVYESHFSRFILNRDRPSIEKGFIFSTDLPPSITQALAIVSRHFYECLDRSFQKFDEFVSKGVPKSVAYATAFNCYFSYSYMPRDANAIYCPLYQHRLFSFPESLQTLVNFAEGLCTEKSLKMKSFRDKPGLDGCGAMFMSNPYDSISPGRPFTYGLLRVDTELRVFLAELRGGSTVVSEVVNPFKRPSYAENESRADPLNVTNNEMFEIILFLTKRGDFKNATH